MRISHRISIRYDKRAMRRVFDVQLLRQCVRRALGAESVDVPCEVSVFVTDDKGIQKINKEFRAKDVPTDVLSFPLQNLVPGRFEPNLSEVDRETGRLHLGDIVLSVDRIAAQAREYGHDMNREMAYLVVHSGLHLLGYDHLDEAEEKRLMRSREKAIITLLGLAE